MTLASSSRLTESRKSLLAVRDFTPSPIRCGIGKASPPISKQPVNQIPRQILFRLPPHPLAPLLEILPARRALDR
jgi:hypothetical protein